MGSSLAGDKAMDLSGWFGDCVAVDYVAGETGRYAVV
jgi:hypothetical protein